MAVACEEPDSNNQGSRTKAQLKDVVRLVPKDQLSAALLKALTQPDNAATTQ
jgi:hypothetical protein